MQVRVAIVTWQFVPRVFWKLVGIPSCAGLQRLRHGLKKTMRLPVTSARCSTKDDVKFSKRAKFMTSRRQFFLASVCLALSGRAWGAEPYPVTHTAAEWRHLLTPLQFEILREAGTETPWSSPLLNEHRQGRFACAGCATPAFDSRSKFESGTGWPSFTAALPHAVQELGDDSLGMERTEVRCATCGGHLGHVFDDGPQPTGLRYCMNGAALTFRPV